MPDQVEHLHPLAPAVEHHGSTDQKVGHRLEQRHPVIGGADLAFHCVLENGQPFLGFLAQLGDRVFAGASLDHLGLGHSLLKHVGREPKKPACRRQQGQHQPRCQVVHAQPADARPGHIQLVGLRLLHLLVLEGDQVRQGDR